MFERTRKVGLVLSLQICKTLTPYERLCTVNKVVALVLRWLAQVPNIVLSTYKLFCETDFSCIGDGVTDCVRERLFFTDNEIIKIFDLGSATL